MKIPLFRILDKAYTSKKLYLRAWDSEMHTDIFAWDTSEVYYLYTAERTNHFFRLACSKNYVHSVYLSLHLNGIYPNAIWTHCVATQGTSWNKSTRKCHSWKNWMKDFFQLTSCTFIQCQSSFEHMCAHRLLPPIVVIDCLWTLFWK